MVRELGAPPAGSGSSVPFWRQRCTSLTTQLGPWLRSRAARLDAATTVADPSAIGSTLTLKTVAPQSSSQFEDDNQTL